MKSALAWIAAWAITVFLAMPTACAGPSQAGTPPAAPGALATTTTLQAQTANNTSAASTFTAQGNGNAAAGNVSKAPVQSLLYSGSNTVVLATWEPWFGSPSHMNVGYSSNNPAQIHSQVLDMVSRGIQGVVIDWFGSNVPILSQASMLMMQEVETHSGFQFAIMEDSGALFNAAVANGCDVTSQLISDLSYINSTFVPSPSYFKIGGKPVIFTFGISQYFIDWTRVLASLPAGELLLFRGPEGMQAAYAGGSFQWIDIDTTNAFDEELAALDAFYSSAQTSGRPAVGATYKGFDDPLAAWGTNRQIHQQCGNVWVNTFQQAGQFYSAGNQLPAMEIVTWNDYEEGSEIESGIDNCAFLVPSASAGTLSWTLGGGASESTISQYTVYASVDGQNLSKLANVPAGTHSLSLAQFNLPSPVSLFVQAVGQSSIRNVMSAPVMLLTGDTPPQVSLNTSVTGNLTVAASTAGSSSSQGIRSVSIDFGDGTVVQEATASHTYAAVGDYVLTATVFDNLGASSVAVTRVEAISADQGVTIFQPPNSSAVNWPTPIVASALSGQPAAQTTVSIDGAPAYATNRGAVNSALKVFVGTHQISVSSSNTSGAVSQSAVSVVGEPNDVPPVAGVTVVPLPQISPTTVLACSATSESPNGFILQYEEKFSDGTVFFTPAAVHTFAAPGSYSVTVDVIDQFGAPGTQSQNFTVTPGAPAPGAMTTAQAQNQEAKSKQEQAPLEPIRRP
jgi:hypothetical protein